MYFSRLHVHVLWCFPVSRSSSSSGSAPSSSPSTPSCWAGPSPSSRACACWVTASCLWPWPWPCAASCWSAARGRSASPCGWWWWRRPSAGPPSRPRPSSPTASRPTARRWWCTRCSSSTSWSGGWSWRSRPRSRGGGAGLDLSRQRRGRLIWWKDSDEHWDLPSNDYWRDWRVPELQLLDSRDIKIIPWGAAGGLCWVDAALQTGFEKADENVQILPVCLLKLCKRSISLCI